MSFSRTKPALASLTNSMKHALRRSSKELVIALPEALAKMNKQASSAALSGPPAEQAGTDRTALTALQKGAERGGEQRDADEVSGVRRGNLQDPG